MMTIGPHNPLLRRFQSFLLALQVKLGIMLIMLCISLTNKGVHTEHSNLASIPSSRTAQRTSVLPCGPQHCISLALL